MWCNENRCFLVVDDVDDVVVVGVGCPMSRG